MPDIITPELASAAAKVGLTIHIDPHGEGVIVRESLDLLVDFNPSFDFLSNVVVMLRDGIFADHYFVACHTEAEAVTCIEDQLAHRDDLDIE